MGLHPSHLLPPPARTGRRQTDDCRTIEGILYVLITGCRWQDLPREYGAPTTAWRRLMRWGEERSKSGRGDETSGGHARMGGRDGVDDDHDLDFDLEFEVSDLRQVPVADAPRVGQRAGAWQGAQDRGAEPQTLGSADAAATPEAHGTPAKMDVDGTPAARAVERTARRRIARRFTARRVRGYAVASLVLLGCAGLLLSLPGTQQALRQVLAGLRPTPTLPLASGENLVYFGQTAPWGRLTLDGTPLEPQFFHSSSLARGRHTLTYQAAPWPVLRCQLSVPAQQGDSCPVDASFHFDEPLARMIDLGATPERLPDAQRKALLSAVAGALQAHVETTAVPPGDHYRGADGRSAVATLPLQASLTLTLNTDAARAASNSVAPGPGPCVSLCGQLGGFGGEGTAWWVIWAHVVAHWHFEAADGTVIDPGASTDLDAGYLLGATWSASGLGGTWSVTLHPYAGSPGAAGVQADLCDPALRQAFPNGAPVLSSFGYGERVYPGPNEADGCVAVFSPSGSSGGGPPVGNATANAATPTPTPTRLPADAAIYIVRFGIVLAGNDVAHAAQPLLPVASAHERALAQQWVTQTQP
jgi:hypothetical protein